jgi:hypothetical protein
VKSLTAQIGGVTVATLAAGLACGLAAYCLAGASGLGGALAATGASWLPGALVMWYFSRYGLTANTAIVATGLRMALTALVAGGLAGGIQELRTSAFLLSLGVTYLANLAAETWYVYEENRQAGGRNSPRRLPGMG